MPITLPPISRRRFLAGSVAAGAELLTGRMSFAAEAQVDPHRFALLADTHIPADDTVTWRGTNMTENLRQVAGELIERENPPATVFIDGDCAHLSGKTADYANLLQVLGPAREAGLTVHLALGNHDQRDRFWKAFPAEAELDTAVADKHVLVLESPRANWFLLDSLDATNQTPGLLGRVQRAWLAEALDERKDKPAIIFLHHNPDRRPEPLGLVDTGPLFDLLEPREQVQAVVFGHTHYWHVARQRRIHLVNLPPTAYVFQQECPNGWVDAHLTENGMRLELRCLDRQHRQHGETVEVRWG